MLIMALSLPATHSQSNPNTDPNTDPNSDPHPNPDIFTKILEFLQEKSSTDAIIAPPILAAALPTLSSDLVNHLCHVPLAL